MADGVGWVTDAGLEAIKQATMANASKAAFHQEAPKFDEAEFEAYVVRATIKPGGDLEITVGVPPKHKWSAFKLSDAAGLMLRFHVER